MSQPSDRTGDPVSDTDPDRTIHMDRAANSAMLRDNAGRILGMMFGGHTGAEKEGDTIGPYRLCERLGEGGFGVVWRAEQTEPVRRQVAVKIIKLGMDTLQVLARFDQERQALASMDHPSIASLLDVGLSPDGRPYFAMELIEGEPVTLWCESRDTPIHERLRIFVQVCQAVQHAHQKGVIHRDLKPTNILVTMVDGRPVPKIIDFGIAKAVHAEDFAGRSLLTRGDQMLGTPRYMSPEQLAGGGVIDTRSDIYSLGVLLYELLTGAPPYDAFGSTEELKRLINERTPLRPSTQIRSSHHTQKHAAAKRRAEPAVPFQSLPRDLDWITMRALEKDCARRYQTAAEFAADLERFLGSQPVLARPPSLGYVTSRWVKRNRAAFAAACFVVLAMVAGTGVALWQARIARAAQRHAETETILARHAEHRAGMAQLQAQQTAGFLTGLLDRISREVSKGRNPEALKAALAESDEDILKLSTGPELRIELLDKIQDIYSTIGEPKLAIPLAQTRAREMAELHGPASPEAFAAELEHIKMVMDFGARATAPALIEDLRKRVEAGGGRGSRFWFEVQQTLSRAWIKLEIPGKALAAAEELMAEAGAQKLSKRGTVLHRVTLAAALEFAGRYDEALSLLEETRRQTDHLPHLNRIDDRMFYLLQRMGDYRRGAEVMRRKLAEHQASLGPQARELIPVLLQLSEFESRNGEHDSAITHGQQALAIAQKHAPADGSATQAQRREVWQALRDLADRESAGGKHREAITHAEESIHVARQMDNEQMVIRSLRDLADFHRAGGNLDKACDIKRESHDRIRQSGANLRDAEQELREMCDIRLEQNRPEEAMQLGLELWAEVLARPEARQDITHLGEIAATMLKCHAALKARAPATPEPPHLAAWQAAVEAGRRLQSVPK